MSTKHTFFRYTIHLFAALLLLFGGGLISIQPAAAASNTCPLEINEPADLFEYADSGVLEFSEFQESNGEASITITNNSDCDFPVALGAYKMNSGNVLSEQELFDQDQVVIAGNSSHTLQVQTPSCMTQIDLLHDPNQNGAPDTPIQANPKLIGFTFKGNEKDIFAENDMFHFASGSPYEGLDNFPNDEDDGYRNASPASDSRYCDMPASGTCPHPNNILPIDEPADLFEYAINDTLEFTQFSKSNGQAQISITNNSNCRLPVALGVYEMRGNNIDDQSLFSEDTAVVESDGDSVTLQSQLPSCMAQIDLLVDADENGAPDTPIQANPDLIGFTFNQNDEDIFAENDMFHFASGSPYEGLDNFPNDEDDGYRNAGPAANFCPADSNTLTGSCSVTPQSVETGETVTWSANANGGATPYSFSWQLEGKSGSFDSQSISTTYDSENDFDGTVTVSDDNGESITRTCTVTVSDDDDNGGGGGGGAILQPRDNGNVRGDRDEDVSLQCRPEKDSYLIGERVNFTVTADGADEDDIEYSWQNVDNLDPSGNTASIQYLSPGSKRVQVEADVNDQNQQVTCRVSIQSAQERQGVRLDEVPHTGVSETFKTIAFVLLLSLLAIGGGVLVLRRFYPDSISVGIPTDFTG